MFVLHDCQYAIIVRRAVLAVTTLTAVSSLPADDAGPDVEAERAERAAAIMDRESAAYAFQIDSASKAKRHPETLLKWSNPAEGSIYGSVYL